MVQTTTIHKESLDPTNCYEKIGDGSSTSAGPAIVYELDDIRPPEPSLPAGFTDIDDFIAELEQEPKIKEGIQNARRWASKALHGSELKTIRTLRLDNGWSQTQLAEYLQTAQSQIAKLESRDTSKIFLETCLKLCDVYKIDMNGLTTLLLNQNKMIETQKNV